MRRTSFNSKFATVRFHDGRVHFLERRQSSRWTLARFLTPWRRLLKNIVDEWRHEPILSGSFGKQQTHDQCDMHSRVPFGMCETWNPGGDESCWKGTRTWHSSSHSKFPYLLGGKFLVKETATQEKFQMTTIVDIEHYYKIIMSAVRSRVSSNIIFASCVRYCDRAYYGFSMTLSRTLVLIEGNKSWQLWNSVSVQIRSMWLWT